MLESLHNVQFTSQPSFCIQYIIHRIMTHKLHCILQNMFQTLQMTAQHHKFSSYSRTNTWKQQFSHSICKQYPHHNQLTSYQTVQQRARFLVKLAGTERAKFLSIIWTINCHNSNTDNITQVEETAAKQQGLEFQVRKVAISAMSYTLRPKK